MSESAARMAGLARSLASQRTTALTLQHVVAATAELVRSCDDVAITRAHPDGSVETRASLGAGLAEQVDQLQAQYGEGSVLDIGRDVPVNGAGDLAKEKTWPRWGAAVADQLDVHSVLCVGLHTHEKHELGALELFSTQRQAFDLEAADETIGIAAHAAVALAAVEDHEAIQFGLVRRTMIGQATGILMERYHLDSHQAFEALRRTSRRAVARSTTSRSTSSRVAPRAGSEPVSNLPGQRGWTAGQRRLTGPASGVTVNQPARLPRSCRFRPRPRRKAHPDALA